MNFEEKTILVFGCAPQGTVEILSQPEEVIEVRPEILALMKARLRGENVEDWYDAEERVSKEFLIHLERQKVSSVFGSADQVLEAFSSLRGIKDIRQELRLAKLDQALLSNYSLKQTHGEAVDEADVYIGLLKKQEPSPKKCRILELENIDDLSIEAKQVMKVLGPYYASTHFAPLLVTREMVQVSKELQGLFKEEPFVDWMDELLGKMYGRSA